MRKTYLLQPKMTHANDSEGDSISHVISLKVQNEFLFSKIVIEHICNTLIKIEVQTLYTAVQHLY
jgi:hypothetical protein